MAREKNTVKVAEAAPGENEKTAVAEAVNSADGVTPKKDKGPKAATTYEVVSLPEKRDRLSPQLRALVDTIDEIKTEVEGKHFVARDLLLRSWMAKIGSDSADKVFASYMHQMLSFAFLDRVGSATTPKKIISPMERKQKLMAQLAQLPEADRLELLASLGIKQ